MLTMEAIFTTISLLLVDRLLRVLNQGNCKSLALLNTIGKKKAKAIVDFRNMNGEFSDVSSWHCYTFIIWWCVFTFRKNIVGRLTIMYFCNN